MPELTLCRDDAFNRLLGRIGLGWTKTCSGRHRVLAAWTATWLVLAALAVATGHAIGPTARQTFFVDLTAYGQFWVGVPLLLFAERFIDGRVRNAVVTFAESGLVRSGDRGRFDEAVAAVSNAKSWWAVDLALLLVAEGAAWSWVREELAIATPSYAAPIGAHGKTLSLVGIWLAVFCVPLWNYLVLRWVWKVTLWFWFLKRVSRLDLHLYADHPDRAGGLGFLGDLQAAFGLLIFAVGTVLACIVAYKLHVEHPEGATWTTTGPVLAFVVVAPVVFVGPLLLFCVQLYEAKEEGLTRYTIVASRYAKAFADRWLGSGRFGAEEFVGTPDLQSFASLHSLFESIEHMRVVPFDLITLGKLIGSAAGPMVPLVGSAFPQVSSLLRGLW